MRKLFREIFKTSEFLLLAKLKTIFRKHKNQFHQNRKIIDNLHCLGAFDGFKHKQNQLVKFILSLKTFQTSDHNSLYSSFPFELTYNKNLKR